jgi:cellulose synthase/poly-beta-1,6-N-acetylglucosamine synthase-like glycosyltransferase
MGYGNDTYILHLDDDSYVGQDYIEYIQSSMESVLGQGSIKLRDYKENNLTALIDTVRVSTCKIHCGTNNIRNKPLFVHGEGIVIRADAEYEIGWDNGLAGAEDLIMGCAMSKSYWVDHIPFDIYINPPTNLKDLFTQRGRWLSHIFAAKKVLYRMNPSIPLFYNLLYFWGISGIIAEFLWIYNVAIGITLNPIIFAFSIVNLTSIGLNYEIGAIYTDKKYALIMPLIFLFLGLIENLTTLYALFRRQDPNDFKVIYKRPVS